MYADHEIHVTADIVYAIAQYERVTGSADFTRRALPLLAETSRYWLDRVSRSPAGAVSLKGVMGPDEYLCFCNDNSYTNYMVSDALRFSARSLRKLTDAENRAELNANDNFLAELDRIDDGLVSGIPKAGVIPQCDRFDELDEPDFDRFWPDRSRPYGASVSQERMYRTKSLKQADALMLPYLFPQDFSDEQTAASYDRYEPYTTHDSSLSLSVHAALCCRLGRLTRAKELFDRACRIDLDEAERGAAEGIHIANCGALWQTVVYGFAGLVRDYERETPKFSPKLPSNWRGLRFKLRWKGRQFDVRVTSEGVEVSP